MLVRIYRLQGGLPVVVWRPLVSEVVTPLVGVAMVVGLGVPRWWEETPSPHLTGLVGLLPHLAVLVDDDTSRQRWRVLTIRLGGLHQLRGVDFADCCAQLGPLS